MKNYIYSTGKRKKSIARVFLSKGNGVILINNLSNYFQGSSRAVNVLLKPLRVLHMDKKVDLKITVKGGGFTGQSEAIRHGVSKAIVKYNDLQNNTDDSFKKILKDFGFLTRDSRKVERKKVGHRKARKKEQYSKR
ncbi:MAG: 30S ribosomal protein S9 [Candidatus Riesia sp.]|nr:30S ribosomal protein S9 [Candidatus Riesia sp.]